MKVYLTILEEYCGKCGALLKNEVDIFEEQFIENKLFEEGEEVIEEKNSGNFQ